MAKTFLIAEEGVKKINRLQEMITDVILPDSITEIGDFAFCGCSSLKSITIPNSITEIGESAFYDCFSLTSITIPSSVTRIGRCAFYYCYSLKSIYIDKERGSLDLRNTGISATIKVYWKGEF